MKCVEKQKEYQKTGNVFDNFVFVIFDYDMPSRENESTVTLFKLKLIGEQLNEERPLSLKK